MKVKALIRLDDGTEIGLTGELLKMETVLEDTAGGSTVTETAPKIGQGVAFKGGHNVEPSGPRPTAPVIGQGSALRVTHADDIGGRGSDD